MIKLYWEWTTCTVDCKYRARNPQERNATVTFERMMQSFQYYFWLIIEVLRVYFIKSKSLMHWQCLTDWREMTMKIISFKIIRIACQHQYLKGCKWIPEMANYLFFFTWRQFDCHNNFDPHLNMIEGWTFNYVSTGFLNSHTFQTRS